MEKLIATLLNARWKSVPEDGEPTVNAGNYCGVYVNVAITSPVPVSVVGTVLTKYK